MVMRLVAKPKRANLFLTAEGDNTCCELRIDCSPTYANWKGMRCCIKAAYSKFTLNEPNLLVIADDFFVSLARTASWQIKVALFATHDRYGEEPGYLATAAYQNLGGIAVFAAEVSDFLVEYRFQIFRNPYALTETAIPPSLASLRA